jgi:hypothetical protein
MNLLALAQVGAGLFRNDLNVLNGLPSINSGPEHAEGNDLNLPREARWWKTFFDCDK